MESFASSNGTNIHYQIRGEGALHVAKYQKHFKCILIDNRGVGKSDQPEGPYSTEMMARDTIAVMDHAKIDKAHVAGISMGGAIAQTVALNYPDRVNKLVLISTWPVFDNYAKTVYRNLKKIRKCTPPDVFMELLQLWIFAPPYYKEGLEELAEGQQGALESESPQSPQGFDGQLDACIGHDVAGRLGEIDHATLITVGEKDIFTPPIFSHMLYTGIRNAALISFSSGGHVHHWEDLERFNAVTLEFLLK
jgi:pimeloyl-ACP methyl ester carboxylesterase